MADEQEGNRRRQERYPVSFPVDYLGGAMGFGHATDLSISGCAVRSDVRVPIKTYLKMQLSLPDGSNPVEIELTVVRWSHGGIFGVEFIAFGQAQKSFIGRGFVWFIWFVWLIG
jgi:PilZ domain